jgi:hypothetical protein
MMRRHLRIGEWNELSVETESGVAKSSLECGDKLTAEDTA